MLALSGAAELGAMNRLRETPRLPTVARWELAAAYALAGRPEAGQTLVAGASTGFPPYRELGGNYGSEVRDQAIVLDALGFLGQDGQTAELVQSLSTALSSDRPLSTQSVAFALMAISRTIGEAQTHWGFELKLEGDSPTHIEGSKAVIQRDLPQRSAKLVLENPSEETLYGTLYMRGIPARTEEQEVSQGMNLEILFEDGEGENLDPRKLDQGMDFDYVVQLTNPEGGRRLENLALTIPVAEGWEIRSVDVQKVALDHQDVRDAHVDFFFDLAAGESLTATIAVTAAFKGRFYLPMVTAEAMYDPSIAARTPGRWVEVGGQ